MSDTPSTMWLCAAPTGDAVLLFCSICDNHVADLDACPSVPDAQKAEVIHWATHDTK